MKRKFINILFSAVLASSLAIFAAPAVPALGEDTLQVVPFGLDASGDNCTAGWTDGEIFNGSSSVELNYDGGSENYASVGFQLLDDVTLNEINLETTSFWCYSTDGDYIPFFCFILGDGDFFIFNQAESSEGYDDWDEFVAADANTEWGWYDGEEGGLAEWDDLVDQYGTATIDGVSVEFAGLAADTYIAYVDDITVNGLTYYGQIHDAIDSATGTIIMVNPGTYVEDLDIEESLTVQSAEGAEETTINGTVGIDLGWGSNATAETVLFDGFTVQGTDSEDTIYLQEISNGSSVTISNNIIVDGDAGVCSYPEAVYNGSTVIITGNEISSCSDDGIQFADVRGGDLGGSTVTIADNEIYDCDEGIELEGDIAGDSIVTVGGDDPLVEGNEIYDCTDGIEFCTHSDGYLWEDSELHINGNDIYDNDDDGIDIGEVDGWLEIEGNTLTNNGAPESNIHIDYAYGEVDIAANDISESGTGIYIYETDDGEVVGDVDITSNCIFHNVYGIYLDEYACGVEIYDNCVVENGEGIWVAGDDNIIGAEEQGNIISSNTGRDGSGVHLTDEAFDNLINYNDIVFNSHNPDGGYGVLNDNFVPVDATRNYWGDASGPDDGEGPGTGTGDRVNEYVNYAMWEEEPIVDAVAPEITSAEASPETVSIWGDWIGDGLWHGEDGEGGNMYSVGPTSFNFLCVDASDARCGIAKVTKNLKQLVLDLIPEETLQALIDEEYSESDEEVRWDEFWEDLASEYEVSDMEAVEMDFCPDSECWWEPECINELLEDVFSVLDISSPPGYTPIMAQALTLGDKEIQVTAYDYSGNATAGVIPVTIVDFQMPVTQGWNLRSTWLTLEDSSWQDIVATTGDANIDSLLRWNGEEQRWEYYAETPHPGWYYESSKVASALMVPLESYWIHSQADDQFGLITSRSITAPPASQMYAGWNLIGAALAWDQPMLYADDGLVSIEENAEGNTGYANVVSIHQHLEGYEAFYICGHEDGGYKTYFQQWPWVLTASDGGENTRLTRGGGYWVFMQNDAVLAGFSTTPLTEAFWSRWPEPP